MSKVFTSLYGSLVFHLTQCPMVTWVQKSWSWLTCFMILYQYCILQPFALENFFWMRVWGPITLLPLGMWITKLSAHTCSTELNFKYAYCCIPSRSVDLSPLHLRVWSHLKEIVFHCKVGINYEIHHQMLDVARHVNDLMCLFRVSVRIGKGIRMCTQVVQKYAAVS